MAEILIHRCTLRVVRRGGWTWGPDPGGMAREAVRILPELLAKKLSELLPDEADREIAAPVRLRLHVRMRELGGAAAAPSGSTAPPSACTSKSLDQRMESALRAALGLDGVPSVALTAPGRDRGAPARFTEEPSFRATPEGGALCRLLLAWYTDGVLERRLVALPADQIECWQHRLWGDAASRAAPDPEAALAQRIETLALAYASTAPSGDLAEILRRRILIATTAAAELSLPLSNASLWRALDAILPVEPPRPSPQNSDPVAGGAERIRETPSPSPADPVASPPRVADDLARAAAVLERAATDWEIKIACVLPFLLLGPLARMGYMAALEAVLEAANLHRDAPLFAAALAYKVLDPPGRGWRRSPASLLAAAALAGLAKPVAEECLVDFSRRIAPHTSPLDLVLTDNLIAGHTPGEPVTVHVAGAQGSDGYLTLDTEGCFPIAWTRDSASLLAILQRLGSPVVLITDEAADPALLRHLDAGGVAFVTGVPPTRGEHWQRIQQGSALPGWTNSTDPATGPLRRAARAMAPALDEARAFHKDLLLARPAVIRAASPELDRSVTLAASVAMGTIAWKLWQSRGRTSPQQVVERYADLEGRCRFDSRSINVALSLGRRHRELLDHGLLAPVNGVPWLCGRRIEYGGG